MKISCWFHCSLLLIIFSASRPIAAQTRALWVTRWDYSSARDIQNIMDNASQLHFNTILFQVRGASAALYSSKIEPQDELLHDSPMPWDPLAEAVRAAHAANLQLHAWINVYTGWNKDVPPSDPSHLFYQHPDWFMQDVYGKRSPLKNGYQWLAPTHPQVTPYLLSVCREIYENYDIDGLHLDYIRFPGETYSYDATSVRRFKRVYGVDPRERPTTWRFWRQNSISTFLDSLYNGARKSKPELIISAAVVANYELAKKIYFQDSHNWLARGSLDAIFPMLYTNDTVIFKRRLENYLRNSHGRRVFAGINLDYDDLAGKLDVINELNPAGAGIFSYEELTTDHVIKDSVRAVLAKFWPEPTSPLPMPWKENPRDNQGPLITQVQSIPAPLPPNTKFKIAARISDESGIYQGITPDGDPGVLLISGEGELRLKMKPIKKTRNWYISESAIPGQPLGTVFQGRIKAYDRARVSAARPHPNVGTSELLSIPIVKQYQQYQFSSEIGPVLRRPGDIAVDGSGHIWVTTEIAGEGPVIVLDSTGTALDFSPLKTGLDGFFESMWMDSVVGFAKGPNNTMLIACNSTPPMIFRFDAETGEPLPGIQLDFVVGAIATDSDGHIFLMEKDETRWHILSRTGIELQGSPFGGGGNGRDLAVLPNGAAVYVSDARSNMVQAWHGAIEADYATYWPAANLLTDTVGAGKLVMSADQRLYIISNTKGLIALANRAGAPVGHILDKNHLTAPLDIAISPSGEWLYHIETVGAGPTKVRQWKRRDGTK